MCIMHYFRRIGKEIFLDGWVLTFARTILWLGRQYTPWNTAPSVGHSHSNFLTWFDDEIGTTSARPSLSKENNRDYF